MKSTALILFLCGNSFGAIAFVRQATNSSTTGTSLAVTVTGATSGNTQIAYVASSGTATGISSISSTNTTWTKIASVGLNNSAAQGVDIWYGSVAGGTGGTSVTITGITGVNHMAANVSEFSGIAATSPVDGPGATNFGSGTSQAFPAFSALTSGDLVVGVDAQANGTAATTPGAPWNSLTVRASGTTVVITPVYQIVVSSGAVSGTFTGSAINWGTVAAALGTNPFVPAFISNPTIISVGP